MSHHRQALAGDVEAVTEEDDGDAGGEADAGEDPTDFDGDDVCLDDDSQPSSKRSRSESGVSESESQCEGCNVNDPMVKCACIYKCGMRSWCALQRACPGTRRAKSKRDAGRC